MTIKKELSIVDFEAWSGATETKDAIVEAGKVEEFDAMIESEYPEGLTETELNDILWFEEKWIFDTLGMSTEDEEEE